MFEKTPLVTIVVVTYNSSKFVLETLESAKAQTYRNIELIVTDDCSTDNTLDLCRIWVKENKERFIRVELFATAKNTGTAPNANRGLYQSKGAWIKFIAGDDMLMSDCIAELISHIKQYGNLDIKFLVHGISPFNKETEFLPVFPPEKLMKLDAKKQFIHLLRKGNCISGSSFFLERETLMAFNGFDENYKLLEDFPLLIKYTQNNHKIWIIKKPLVAYRIHGNNVSFENSYMLQDSHLKLRDELLIPLIKKHKLYLTLWHNYILMHQNANYKILNMLLMSLSPIGWISKAYKIFGKSYFYNHKIEFQKKRI